MLGDTITVTVNSVAKTLTKINQDGYGSEYLLKETSGELRLKVRHSKERTPLDGKAIDRHNVELTRVTYPNSEGLGGNTRQTYLIIRNPVDTAVAEVGYDVSALCGFLSSSTIAKLIGWES